MNVPTPHQKIILYVLPLIIFFGGSWFFRDYVVDDAYIHLTFVKNLAATGEFAFNRGTPVYGTTSPLWVMINALVLKALSGLSAYSIIKTLSLMFAATSLLLFTQYCNRRFSFTIGIVLSVLFACNPWYLRWAYSGMEVGLVLTLSLSMLLLADYLKGIPLGIALGLLCGLLLLTRPEFILFTLVLSIHLIADKNLNLKQRVLLLLAFFGAILLIAAPWAVYADSVFGNIKPNTVLAKSTGYYLIPELMWIKRLVLILVSGHSAELLLLGICGITAFRNPRAVNEWTEFFRSTLLLWAWPCGLAAGYLFTHSPISSRYMLMGSPFLVLFIGNLMQFSKPAIGKFSFESSKQLIPFALVGITSSAVLLATTILPQTKNYREALENYSRLVDTFERLSKDGDKIAAGDVGILGYQNIGKYEVVDLHGLVTTSAIPVRRFLHDVNFYLRDNRVEWLMESAPAPNNLAHTDKLTIIQQDLWLIHPYVEFIDSAFLGPYGVAESENQYYSLYRINWGKFDEDHPLEPSGSLRTKDR